MQQEERGEEGGYWAEHSEAAGYKYELRRVQVSSDHSPENMRLLALLLMVGAAGKDIHTDTYIRI